MFVAMLIIYIYSGVNIVSTGYHVFATAMVSISVWLIILCSSKLIPPVFSFYRLNVGSQVMSPISCHPTMIAEGSSRHVDHV